MPGLVEFKEHEGGVSAVEFALVLPVLLALIIGIIDFSMILFAKNVTQDAARVTVREVSVNRMSASGAELKVKSLLPSFVAGAVTVTTHQTDTANHANNEITVAVSFLASSVAITGLFSPAYGSLNLSSQATMRQEPPL